MISVRRFLTIERRIFSPSSAPRRVAEPECDPGQAEAVLAALAARYRPGDVVSAHQIAEASGLARGDAMRCRRFLMGRKRWPYRIPATGRRPDGELTRGGRRGGGRFSNAEMDDSSHVR